MSNATYIVLFCPKSVDARILCVLLSWWAFVLQTLYLTAFWSVVLHTIFLYFSYTSENDFRKANLFMSMLHTIF